MTSSLYTAPHFSGDHPTETSRAMTFHQFWASLIVSLMLFTVATFVGGEALSFEGSISAPQHTRTP